MSVIIFASWSNTRNVVIIYILLFYLCLNHKVKCLVTWIHSSFPFFKLNISDALKVGRGSRACTVTLFRKTDKAMGFNIFLKSKTHSQQKILKNNNLDLHSRSQGDYVQGQFYGTALLSPPRTIEQRYSNLLKWPWQNKILKDNDLHSRSLYVQEDSFCDTFCNLFEDH